jgi:FKBP-type peptidyl-prolyl cis-trans isomerase 2
MNASAPLKALALVVFLAALAGATYGVQQVLGDNVAGQLLRAEPTAAAVNATPGNAAAYAITVRNLDVDARDVMVALSGGGVDARSPLQSVPGKGGATVFLPVAVPAGLAPGDHALDLRILGDDGAVLRESPQALTLRVLAPGAGYAAGQDATFVYTGRLEDGAVFTTNDPALQALPFRRAETFRPGLLPPPALLDALVGMQAGESRVVPLSGERAYSNLSEERIPRVEDVPRREALPLPSAELSADEFAAYLDETGQARPEGYRAGDAITSEQNGETLRYEIVSMAGGSVALRLKVEPGEHYTVYGFWPNASVVESANETHAVFVTTPTTGEAEPITFYSYWPDLTYVAGSNETSISLRHDPPVGHKYTRTPGQFQPPVTYTVRSVSDKDIVVTAPSGNPLAGLPVAFDVRMERFG